MGASEQEEKPEKQDSVDKLKDGLSWPIIILCIVAALFSLYVFLVGLSLMGSSFKVLGGKGASSVFAAIDNPVSGLMAGIMSTVLVQSSSTTTSMLVAMVGEGTLSVHAGIPVIMGANIGTSVTNTIVSMGQIGNRIDLERSFAGATVHDMFNMLTVCTLLPLEVIIGAIQGEGGPLYWISKAFTELFISEDPGGELFDSPIKTITKPIASGILKANKYVIYAATLAEPEPRTPTAVSAELCEPLDSTRRLSESDQADDKVVQDSRALLSRRTSTLEDCSTYWCISKNMDKNFKKIDEDEHEKLVPCTGRILDMEGEPCGSNLCYMDGGKFYDEKVTKGSLISGGFLEDMGDTAGGIVGLIISLILLCLGLVGLCKSLQAIFMGNAKRIIRYATGLNDYVAIVIGFGITILVQSSSVTTSALTPLCGIGVLPLDKMLPLTLGANIGTTVTALIASLVVMKFDGLHIALCHFFFNIIGICIWFPVPAMRRLPLGAARLLGLYASYYRFVPGLYILIAFIIIPGTCLAISAVFNASIAGGVILMLMVLAGVGVFEYLWLVGVKGGPLCYKVLSQEQREIGARELAEAQAAVRGSVAAEDEGKTHSAEAQPDAVEGTV